MAGAVRKVARIVLAGRQAQRGLGSRMPPRCAPDCMEGDQSSEGRPPTNGRSFAPYAWCAGIRLRSTWIASRSGKTSCFWSRSCFA